jgi:hypothetical protein
MQPQATCQKYPRGTTACANGVVSFAHEKCTFSGAIFVLFSHVQQNNRNSWAISIANRFRLPRTSSRVQWVPAQSIASRFVASEHGDLNVSRRCRGGQHKPIPGRPGHCERVSAPRTINSRQKPTQRQSGNISIQVRHQLIHIFCIADGS